MLESEFKTIYTRIGTKDVEHCVGKTVESAYVWDDKYLCLRFADGTYFCCGAEQGYEMASLSIDCTFDENDALHMGLIDSAELKRVKDARQAKAKAAREAGEREMYKRLRAVYEAEFGPEFKGV